MDRQNRPYSFDPRRRFVRTALERVQEAIRGSIEIIEEPEVISPKAAYEVEESLNITYINSDEMPLSMDIFKPAVNADTKLPVIVDVHGGRLMPDDHRVIRDYCRSLASRGYLVFSIEYRLAPAANVFEQLDDVCSGLDQIGCRLEEHNADTTRVFMTTESAGAYLALYVSAMAKSEKLQNAMGFSKPGGLTFTALGLHGGMYYIGRDDPIGWLMADQIYGEKIPDKEFLQYLDPEHEEIVKNLPPVFMTTSKGDFLNKYTLMYHEALKKAGRRSHLVYYGDDKLGHAFVAMDPNRAESIDAVDRMTDWFEEQAEAAKEDRKRHAAETRALKRINERISDGSITKQKLWQFVRELNSYSRDQLDSTAIVDCSKEYTYRQMFRMWDSYAEVFSALGITGRNGSRAGMTGVPSAESVSSLFALNMTGASVSVFFEMDKAGFEMWKKVTGTEGITDVILDDVVTSPALLSMLAEKKEELGIRNIIVLHHLVSGEDVPEQVRIRCRKNYRKLKKIEGVLFMDDLLGKHEAYPIEYSTSPDETAVILHTSGTTSGIAKPIPISDEGLSEAAARLLRDENYANLRERATTCSSGRLVMSYEMIDGMLLPFTFGGKVIVRPLDICGFGVIEAISKYRINVLFGSGFFIDLFGSLPFRPDLSALEYVFLGGTYTSVSTKKKFNKFLRKSGSSARAAIGYGLTEAGAACIVASPDRDDDAIGYPLPGVKVKIYDEEEQKYYDIGDGPRTGVLFINSASVSCGRIGDKVFFELDDIDGEKYLNTYDCVRVNEDGSLSYAGRMNRFFVNHEGVRFDAGLVETSVSAEEGIKACALVPGYSKWMHDTVPVLYVNTSARGRTAEDIVRRALRKVFIKDGRIKDTNMPSQVVLAEELPVNASGKVDVNRIRSGGVDGRRFAVQPVRANGRLVDVQLISVSEKDAVHVAGMPEEVEGIIRMEVPPTVDSGGDGSKDEPEGMICALLSELF